jgi:hypothetical protein
MAISLLWFPASTSQLILLRDWPARLEEFPPQFDEQILMLVAVAYV